MLTLDRQTMTVLQGAIISAARQCKTADGKPVPMQTYDEQALKSAVVCALTIVNGGLAVSVDA